MCVKCSPIIWITALSPPQGDIKAMIEEMRFWYDNYCFCRSALDNPTLYNCDMVLYYINAWIKNGCAPEEMVDKNVRTDYSKLKMLVDMDMGRRGEQRLDAIKDIANKGYAARLFVSGDGYYRYPKFLLSDILLWNAHRGRSQRPPTQDDNPKPMCESTVLELFVFFLSQRDKCQYPTSARRFRYHGRGWGLGACHHEMLADSRRFPEAVHSCIIELKYVRTNESDSLVDALVAEGADQVQRYASDAKWLRLAHGTTVHGLVLVIRGHELVRGEQTLELHTQR